MPGQSYAKAVYSAFYRQKVRQGVTMIRHFLISPDSFKGGISSRQFCEIASEEIKRIRPEAVVQSIPIADGGEGTLESLAIAVGGEIHNVMTEGPYHEAVESQILFTKKNEAVIEIAQCAGLPLAKDKLNPELTSTVGVGRLIEYAVNNGAKHIVLTLGGSCTNDGGAGMLAALGIKFLNSDGAEFIPTGKNLGSVFRIEEGENFGKYKEISFTAMCDVKNPLFGEYGCSRIFARQKGADDAMIERLEAGMIRFSEVSSAFLGKDDSSAPGAGAAGGLGFACRAFLGAELKSGIETVLALCGFDRLANNAELVITGEGRFDSQSLMGKVIGGIISHSGNTPVAVLCGKYLPFDTAEYPNLKYIVPISEGQELAYAIAHEPDNLRYGIKKMFELLEKEGNKSPASY